MCAKGKELTRLGRCVLWLLEGALSRGPQYHHLFPRLLGHRTGLAGLSRQERCFLLVSHREPQAEDEQEKEKSA